MVVGGCKKPYSGLTRIKFVALRGLLIVVFSVGVALFCPSYLKSHFTVDSDTMRMWIFIFFS